MHTIVDSPHPPARLRGRRGGRGSARRRGARCARVRRHQRRRRAAGRLQGRTRSGGRSGRRDSSDRVRRVVSERPDVIGGEVGCCPRSAPASGAGGRGASGPAGSSAGATGRCSTAPASSGRPDARGMDELRTWLRPTALIALGRDSSGDPFVVGACRGAGGLTGARFACGHRPRPPGGNGMGASPARAMMFADRASSIGRGDPCSTSGR